MTIYAAYALMLLLPVLLTIVVYGSLILFRSTPLAPLGGVFAFVALLPALAVVGVPYMVMSLGLVFWARHRPPDAIRRAANLAPVILWLLVVLGWSIIWLSRGIENPPFPVKLMPRLFVWMSALVLGVGYVWVILAHRLVRWLRQREFVVGAA